MEAAVSLVFGVLALAVVVWLYLVLPYQMAVTRHRNGVVWVLISLVRSPLLAILSLIALGPA